MNTKKYITAVLAAFMSVCAFAYPVVQDDDQTTQLVQQYAEQTEQFIQQFQNEIESKLLPSLKALSTLALEVQASAQSELTAEQEAALEKYTTELDTRLNELLTPILKDFDLAQFNEQYAQTSQAYNLPKHQFTLQEATDMIKGAYLSMALLSFAQSQKLTEDELAVLAEIFSAQEEEPAAAE